MKKFLFVVLCFTQLSVFSQDLIVTNYSGATSFDVYEEFLGEVTVKNAGIVPVNTFFYVGLYLSTDNKLDTSDVGIGDITIGSLKVGESFTRFPPHGVINVPPGNYYLIIKVDIENRIEETDETNNLLIIPNIVINPPNVDFTFTSFSLDKSTYSQNSMVKPSYVLENLGSTNTGGTVDIQYFLSNNAFFDQGDIHIHSSYERLKGPDKFTSANYLGFVLPPHIGNGSYYIIVKIDYDYWGNEHFEETNKSNNTIAIPITIFTGGADLEINRIFSASFSSGTLLADIGIANRGNTGVGGYSVGAALIKGSDLPYYYYSPYYLDPMETYVEANSFKSFTISIYIGQPTEGTYYVVYKVNHDYAVSESNYQNNIYIDYSNPIVIGPPPVRGVFNNQVSITGTVNDTDKKVNLNLNLTNTGNVKDYNQAYTFQIRDGQENLLHSQNTNIYINFNPGQTENKAVVLNLASPLPIGSYNIRVTCTSACHTTPSLVTAEFAVVKTPFTVSGIVQGEDGEAITKGKLFLYQDDGSGNIKFVQKTDPYLGSGFSFAVDTKSHTLYFIPDPIQFPEYVPTILGKTFILQETNFFTASENLDLIFEVLKVQDIGTGTGVINGYVTSGNSTLSMMAPLSSTIYSKDIPVMLISQNNQVIGITYTDEVGYYEFKNLPREPYQIMLALELDNPHLMSPILVDISDINMKVDFELKPEGIFPASSQLFLPQKINFEEFTTYQYGGSPIPLDAQSDTGLTIEYLSSDENIAKIEDDKIYIQGVGIAIITAKQSGDNFYLPASVNRTLNIDKGNQVVVFDEFNPFSYGDPAISLDAYSNVGLPIEYSSSDENVATILNDKVHIQGVGSIVITAKQTGNSLYLPSSVDRVLNINKGTQIITFNNFNSINYGDPAISPDAHSNAGLPIEYSSSDESIAKIVDGKIYIEGVGSAIITAKQNGNALYNPALVDKTIIIGKGFQTINMGSLADKRYGDNPFDVEIASTSGLPVKLSSSDPTIASIDGKTITIHNAGKVNILAEQPGNEFYNSALATSKQLTIEKAEQTISFNALPEEIADSGTLMLTATASSGLGVIFQSSDEEVVSINGNSAKLHKNGTVTITAYQYGNENYLAADPVAHELVVNLVLNVNEIELISHVYPNPTSGYVFVENNEFGKIEVYDVNGRIRKDVTLNGNRLDFSNLEKGVYFLKTFNKNKSRIIKIIKM